MQVEFVAKTPLQYQLPDRCEGELALAPSGWTVLAGEVPKGVGFSLIIVRDGLYAGI